MGRGGSKYPSKCYHVVFSQLVFQNLCSEQVIIKKLEITWMGACFLFSSLLLEIKIYFPSDLPGREFQRIITNLEYGKHLWGALHGRGVCGGSKILENILR